jgi:hypothetical protein
VGEKIADRTFCNFGEKESRGTHRDSKLADEFKTCDVKRGRIVIEASSIFAIMEAYTWEGGASTLGTIVEVNENSHESIMPSLTHTISLTLLPPI